MIMNDKSIEEIAVETFLGMYGKGTERDSNIESLGYNPKRVQKIINKGLKYGFSDAVLGKKTSNTTKTAKTSDGTTIKYTDIWDLSNQVIKYFEKGKGKNLSKSKKYVVVSYKDSNGKTQKSKLYYSDIKEGKKIYNEIKKIQNNNKNSWSTEDDKNREKAPERGAIPG